MAPDSYIDESECSFNTTLPVIVYTRSRLNPTADWQELERGPGFYRIPAGHAASVHIKSINDEALRTLMVELNGCLSVTSLVLAENRNVTDAGLVYLKSMPHLQSLNLSSCSVTSTGLESIKALPRLTWLDLSYCNRLTDACLKSVQTLKDLVYLNVQGCVKLTNGGLAKLRRRGLEIHR